MVKKYCMERKKLLIIILVIIIIIAIISFNILKSDVNLDVHGEKISNTSEIYIICKIQDNSGNIVDTSIGMLSIERQFKTDNENAMGSVEEYPPIKNGISIIRENDEPSIVNVHYDGGYFYNPCDYSGELLIENSTDLTDENITPPY